jgi:hypothetical protein
MKKRPKLEGCNNLQIGVKSILQKINPIKRINEKKKMDNGQPQDINKRQFIKKGLFGVGIGALAALLSKIPFARAVQNIKYDDGTNAMSISSDGVVDMPNQSGAKARLTSNQTISTATYQKLSLATEIYDIQNEFDSSTNYRFTATNAGKYLITGNGMINSAPNAGTFWVMIYVNGSEVARTQVIPGATSDFAIGVTDIRDLSASDYVELFVYQNSGSDQTAEVASGKHNYLCVYKIG